MTSDDTNSKILATLEENQNFGMEKDQIIILKQKKVPAVIDSTARFSLLEKDGLLAI